MGKKKISTIAMMIFIILFFELLYLTDSMYLLQNMIYDSVYETEGIVNKKIVIVGIDDQAYENIGRWPFSRTIQSEIFKNILKDKPLVLGIDILYDSRVSTNDDDKLLKTLTGEPVVIAKSLNGYDTYGAEKMIEPFNELNQLVITGYINSDPDKEDGIVRSTEIAKMYKGQHVYSFAYEIYRQVVNINKNDPNVDGAKYIDFVTTPYDNRVVATSNGDTIISSNHYDVISADDVYSNPFPEGYFEDKIVLFGPFSEGMQDSYVTPLDKTNKMNGIEIHANILQNLMDDSFKSDSPVSFEMVLIFIAGILSFYLGRKFTLKIALVFNTLLIIMTFGLGILAYNLGHVVNIVYPMTIIVTMSITVIFLEYLVQLLEKKRITSIFGRYVAPEIVNQILEEGDEHLKLGGNKRNISVLFVDIRGFTPLSEVAEPEMVVEILNEYLELCSNAIFNNNGTLDKFIGDATMAIFNAPLSLEDHEFYAVKTAWEMKVKGEELAEELYARYTKDIRFGIGINTGDAIVGNIGSKSRMDYTAIGDAVNVSARLESNAKPGQILISEATYEKVKERILATSLGLIAVKGKQMEINVFQVDGII